MKLPYGQHLGKLFKELRFSRRLSKEHLADATGISEERITYFEKELILLNGSDINHLCEMYNVDLSYTITEKS